MTRFVFSLLLLFALPGLAGESATRLRMSANGDFSVRLVVKGAAQCVLEVSRDSGVVWRLEQCVGGLDDLYFVSNDGERVWVLLALAAKGTQKLPGKANKKVPAWANTPVALEVDRQGTRMLEHRLLDFMEPHALPEVRHMTQHIKWLEGALGVPGKGPRLTDAGQVEFETVGSPKTHKLTF